MSRILAIIVPLNWSVVNDILIFICPRSKWTFETFEKNGAMYTNQHNIIAKCGVIAQMVEQRTVELM